MLHTSQGNIFHLYWGWHLADWFKNSLKIHALLLSLSCELLACGLCLEVLQRSPALCTMIGSNNQPLSCNRLLNFCCKKMVFWVPQHVHPCFCNVNERMYILASATTSHHQYAAQELQSNNTRNVACTQLHQNAILSTTPFQKWKRAWKWMN